MVRRAFLKQTFSLLAFASLSFSGFVFSNDRPVFSRYIGTLLNERIQKEQLAILEFIVTRETPAELGLSAVLTLHFGGFDTGEYVSYYFENIRYVIKNNQLIFIDSNEPLSLISTTFSQSEGLKAEVHTPWTGRVGTLHLRQSDVVAPHLPIVPKVSGYFHGNCEGTTAPVGIQLYPYRSSMAKSFIGNPFAAYKLRGQHIVTWKEDLKPTVRRIIEGGSYDFFNGTLELDGDSPVACKITDALECGSCRYAIPTVTEKHFKPKQAEPAFKDDGQRKVFKSGVYRGYIHHEYLDQYQLAEMDFRVFVTNAGTRLISSGRIYFGDRSGEFIPFSFEEMNYPSPVIPQTIVFKNGKTQNDPIVQLWSYEDGKIRGIWYSKQFGRVGTLELSNGEIPTLPASAKIMERITARYKGANKTDWRTEIKVRKEDTVMSSDPFSPNGFRGWFYRINEKDQYTAMVKIVGGSLDFFTGRIAFEVDFEEMGQSAWVGERQSRKQMSLNRVHSQWGVRLDETPLSLYVER